MDTAFVKDFHLLPTELGPVAFHAGSYRLFQLDAEAAATLEALENGQPARAEAVERLRAELARAVDGPDFQLKSSILGDNVDLSVFYFFVSQDCNLNCLYCYGDGGDYGKGRMLMSEQTAQDFLDRFITKPGHRYMINLFGGEPLMNLPLLKRFVAMVEEKRQRLGCRVDVNVTTNGTLWNDDIRDFLRDHVTNITVSLDGPPEVHDTQRPARGSFSPYERALRTLAGLREIKPDNTVIRTIVTHDSCRQVGDIYRHNAALAPGGVGLTTVDVDPANPLAMSDQDHLDMLEQIVATNRASLMSFAEDDDPQFFEYTFDLFEMVFFRRYRANPCNAGRAVGAVAADGDIYPCHRFVGKDGFRLGNVSQDPPLNDDHPRIATAFREAGVDANPTCSGCWARYLCGGCCYVIALLRSGDIATPPAHHCRLKRTVYHELLTTFAAIMADEAKAAKLVANVTRMLAGRAQAAC